MSLANLVNLQRKIAVDVVTLRDFFHVVETVEEINGRGFAVALVSDRRMTELNKFFRDKNTTTDVLSFPYEPDEFDPDKDNLGDIVISVEQAQKQAGENNLTLEGEIKQLILHGVLHLCGYDHETDDGEMNARELELRQQLGI
ncbi:MAG: rRNA maturation RNase YbeY [Acidobacteria bacterium]|nr:rRNA maturation RNase YbeY [Acidobacteriota bacterium]